jgi:uncharacterized C2H2 Zn-finger protein
MLSDISSLSLGEIIISWFQYYNIHFQILFVLLTMSHKFNMDFKKSWITRRGPKLILSACSSASDHFHPGTKKCYEFLFLNWKDRSPEKIQVTPVKLHHHKWLFGPATKLSTRSIVYPCSRGKCSLPCPCLICQKKLPVCKVGPECDCMECSLYKEDHKNYHGCLHLDCNSCDSLVKSEPNLKFSLFDKNRKPPNRGIYTDEILEPSFKLPPASDPRRPRSDMLNGFLERENWSLKKKNFIDGVEDESLWCFVCSTMFFYEDMLSEHLAKHGVSKIFRHNFENEDGRTEAKPDLKCYQCSKTFNSTVELTRHVESVHFRESIECPDCDESFSRKDNYETHRKAKHTSSPASTWDCGKCTKTFTMKRNLDRHKREVCTYGKIYVIKCDFCDATFIRASDLKMHKRNRTVKFTCGVCDEKFCNTKILLVHMKEHDGVACVGESGGVTITIDKSVELELFGCEVCGKNFGKEKTLLQHKTTHTDKMEVKCTDCGTKFSLLKNLRRHVKEAFFEDGSPIYGCKMCDEYFCTGKLRGAHVNSSHKKFSCPICKEPFTNKQNLERHIGKRKAVFCAHCEKVFCNQKRYKEHMNLRHTELI